MDLLMQHNANKEWVLFRSSAHLSAWYYTHTFNMCGPLLFVAFFFFSSWPGEQVMSLERTEANTETFIAGRREHQIMEGGLKNDAAAPLNVSTGVGRGNLASLQGITTSLLTICQGYDLWLSP